jgi:1,2-diacylglycerol 3-alpha-glucosyltransferase
MRIVMFSNTYKPTVSGVVTSMSTFRQGLLADGHDVHIVAPEYADYQDKEPYVFRIPSIDLPERVDLSLALPIKTSIARTIRGIKPNVIHSQHPLIMGDVAARLAEDLNVPLVFTFHSLYDVYAQTYLPLLGDLAGWVTDEIVRRYLANCSHIVAPMPAIRDVILDKFELDVPVSVIPTPVDLSQYRQLEPTRVRAELGLDGAELLLYVGRLADDKNLDFLLDAFVRVAAKRPRARLLLVGKGPAEKSLQRHAGKTGLGDRIIFQGAVDHDKVPHYAAAADLFISASRNETQGLVLIEAMAAGTPVVSMDSPGAGDVLTGGGGQLVSGDEDDFATAVLKLLGDEPRRKALGEEAERIVRAYAIPTATARLVSVYEEAVGRTTQPQPHRDRVRQSSAAEWWRELEERMRVLDESLSRALGGVEHSDNVRQHFLGLRARLHTLLHRIERWDEGETLDDT